MSTKCCSINILSNLHVIGGPLMRGITVLHWKKGQMGEIVMVSYSVLTWRRINVVSLLLLLSLVIGAPLIKGVT